MLFFSLISIFNFFFSKQNSVYLCHENPVYSFHVSHLSFVLNQFLLIDFINLTLLACCLQMTKRLVIEYNSSLPLCVIGPKNS